MEPMIGTYDRANRAFVVEREEYRRTTGKPNVRMSIRRLQKLYPDCPNDERGARPYWHRYLRSVLLGDELEAAKQRFKKHDPIPNSPFERGPDGEIRKKLPMTDDERRMYVLMDGINDENNPIEFRHHLREELKAELTKSAPSKAESLKAEIEAYLERRRITYKNKKAVLLVQQYLYMFLEITGDIKLEQIKRRHYEAYHEKVITYPTWTKQRSRSNAMQRLNSFLTHLETVHENLNFKFRHAADFKIRGANIGQKNQWEIEDVQKAIKLSKDNPRVRFALLMAINTGAYWGDLMKPKPGYHGLQKDDIKGEYLKEVSREKNNTKDRIVKGTWWLFPETRKALLFGLTKSQLEASFTSFRDEHGLPLFLDIRKTMSQLIHDDVGETEARLWRCEELEGCIGTNYVKVFSEPQIADLKRALVYVREVLIEGKPRRDKWGNIRETNEQ